jgi:hypothetical protein
MKKNIGIVITDGVGFRNFLLSDFLGEAKNKFSKVVILSCLPKESYQELELDCEIIELKEFKENFINWFFRKLKEVAHLQLHSKGNFGIKTNLDKNYSTSNTPRGIATRLIFKLTRFFKNEKCIQFYYHLQTLSFKNKTITKEYQNIIKDYKLDLIFFTHQRPPFIAPIIYSAKKLGVKTCSFIFSWDNLASKGRMAGNFDFYLVWSDLMKVELLKYYPNVLEENVSIVGTPQFEPYVLEKYNLGNEEFCAKFNIEKDRPILFYSCGDVSTSPNDNYYIETIAEAILNKSIRVDVNFVVRVSPAENGKRFDTLVEKYPFITWNYPKWISYNDAHQESWSQRVPTLEDVFNLKSLLANCAVSINMLSTMSLDAMFFQKPVVNTVFGDGNNGLWNDQKFLKYEHIKTVLKTEATYLVKNESELINSINSLLSNFNEKIQQQKTLLDLQIGAPLEGTSRRIAEVLYEWS